MLSCTRTTLSVSLLFLSAFLLISSHGVLSQSHQIEPETTQGLVHVGEYIVMGKTRILAERTQYNSSLVLAQERTRRRDPLNSFKRYTGGWNISERHYWASVGFTAVPLFAVGLVWFVIFGLSLLCICCCYCCCPRAPYGYSRTAYALSLIFLILFTVAAIVGCVVLYTGQGKFNNSTGDALHYVVSQANVTVERLRNVSEYLDAAKRISVLQVFLGGDLQAEIDSIDRRINSSSTFLADKTAENSDAIEDVLRTVRLILIVIAAVMLLLTFLGFLFSIFGMQYFVSFLVIIGWILVAATFILCGVFLLLHNVVADTCVSMGEWVQHPTAYTALDDILPCVDNATATDSLMQTKEVSSQLVNVVNRVVNNVSNANLPRILGPPLYYNQSGPLVPLLCNPFNADLTDRACAPGEVSFDNATEVWQRYVCQVSSGGVCTTVGRITPDYYDQMGAAVNVSFGLYHYGPPLVELRDCTFVRQTFSKIHDDHCPGLKRYGRLIYIGLGMVSAAVMHSLIFWVIYARERRHRVYTKNLLQGYNHGTPGENKSGM